VSCVNILQRLKKLLSTGPDKRGQKQEIHTPLKTDGHRIRTPESNVRQTPPSSQLQAHGPDDVEAQDVNMRGLLSSIEALRAVASISSLPSLRRFTVGQDPAFPTALAELLHFLPAAAEAVAMRRGTEHEEIRVAMQAIEQACLVAIETLSHVRSGFFSLHP
jgi:hypothetical protein